MTRTHCGTGGDVDLPFQHRHGVGQRADTVPAQFHVEVQPAADDVGMVVDQPGQHALALEVDNPGAGASQCHDVLVVADSQDLAVLDGDGTRRRVGTVKGGDQPMMQDQVGGVVFNHGSLPRRCWNSTLCALVCAPGFRHLGRHAALRQMPEYMRAYLMQPRQSRRLAAPHIPDKWWKLFADEDAKKTDKRNDRRCGGADIQQSIDGAHEKAGGSEMT